MFDRNPPVDSGEGLSIFLQIVCISNPTRAEKKMINSVEKILTLHVNYKPKKKSKNIDGKRQLQA